MCVCVPGQLWVSVSGGKVMVFDASSWSLTHTCHVGNARLVKKKHGRHTKFSLVLSRSYDKTISFLSKSVK